MDCTGCGVPIYSLESCSHWVGCWQGKWRCDSSLVHPLTKCQHVFSLFLWLYMYVLHNKRVPPLFTTGWFGTEGNFNSSNQAPKLMDGSNGYVCVYIYVCVCLFIYVLFCFIWNYLFIYLSIYLYVCVCVCVHFLSGFVWKWRISEKSLGESSIFQ